MSLRQKVKLELESGEEITVEYSAIDLRAWETKHKRSALDEQLSISMLSWLGWNAAHRQGLLNGHGGDTWEQFDPILASVEGVSEDEERPTKKGAAKKTATPKAAGPDSSAP